MIFALVGNQNCGKTTLFNALTGSNQHVGNFPGVTVEQKSGEVKGVKNCSVVDLPGIYSLRPYTQEEIVSRDFIINQKPDCIINIIDATNIERNLYLTLQLLELRVPTVIALNMMDEVYANGGTVDVQQLSRLIGVPVVPISAVKGEGVSELIDRVVDTARKKALPGVTDFCADDSPVHRCIHAVIHLIQDHADRLGVSSRFCTAKLIEGDPELAGRLELDENERELLEHCIVQMESESGLDRNAALADMRYSFIEGVVSKTVVKCLGAHGQGAHRKVYGDPDFSCDNVPDLLPHLQCHRLGAVGLAEPRYRRADRPCRPWTYGVWDKPGRPLAGDRRYLRRGRERAVVPADNRDAVLLPLHP